MGGSWTAQQYPRVSYVLNLGNRFSKRVAGSSQDPQQFC